jgi:adenylylsulfate kinase-like enzyme
MTGVDSPYEPPEQPDLHLVSATVDDAVRAVLALLD